MLALCTPAPMRRWTCAPVHQQASEGISVLKPRLGGVGIPALLPEAEPIVFEELDLADPFRALPRVELRRDHPAGPAMLAGERPSFPRMDEEHVFLDRPREGKVHGVRDSRSGHVVAAGAEHELRLGSLDGE